MRNGSFLKRELHLCPYDVQRLGLAVVLQHTPTVLDDPVVDWELSFMIYNKLIFYMNERVINCQMNLTW